MIFSILNHLLILYFILLIRYVYNNDVNMLYYIHNMLSRLIFYTRCIRIIKKKGPFSCTNIKEIGKKRQQFGTEYVDSYIIILRGG